MCECVCVCPCHVRDRCGGNRQHCFSFPQLDEFNKWIKEWMREKAKLSKPTSKSVDPWQTKIRWFRCVRAWNRGVNQTQLTMYKLNWKWIAILDERVPAHMSLCSPICRFYSIVLIQLLYWTHTHTLLHCVHRPHCAIPDFEEDFFFFSAEICIVHHHAYWRKRFQSRKKNYPSLVRMCFHQLRARSTQK